MLSLILVAVVLPATLFAVSTYASFSATKTFADDIKSLKQAMDTLVSTSDKGSFTKVPMRIPPGGSFIADNATGKLSFVVGGEKREYTAPGTLVWHREYGPGTYDIQLYYGNPSFPAERDNNTIAFR
jgi:hypothetical protein